MDLDNVPGARVKAEEGKLCLEPLTLLTNLKLTRGEKFMTDALTQVVIIKYSHFRMGY
jgi:hypothetical protein